MRDSNKVTSSLLSKEEWEVILNLSTSSDQHSFIETSQECLDDARTNAYGMKWDFYGIYLETTLIGFAMHGRQTFRLLPFSMVWLDRFMIDKKYQGKGYGKLAMQSILPKMRSGYRCKNVFLSVFEGNIAAISLYEKLGFRKTLFKEPSGERIMVQKSMPRAVENRCDGYQAK